MSTIALELYWIGREADAQRVLESGFWDETVRFAPVEHGAYLAEEHYLTSGIVGFLKDICTLRVRFTTTEADAEYYAVRMQGMPFGGYVFPANVLNALRPDVTVLSDEELLRMYRDRGEEWMAKIERENAAIEAVTPDES